MIAFERALSVELEKHLRKLTSICPSRTIKVSMPVIGKMTNKTKLDIIVILDKPSTPKNPIILTWYLDSSTFSNPLLRK